jgi:hypothetical protein
MFSLMEGISLCWPDAAVTERLNFSKRFQDNILERKKTKAKKEIFRCSS